MKVLSYTITLIIADAALETVPSEIVNHTAVQNQARKLELGPPEILLDRSYHHAAMGKLPDSPKRGRPDIVHFALMEALGTPLFMKDMMKVHVHTINNKLISIAENLRIPKSYFRFEFLMIKLFREKIIKSDSGTILMRLSDGTFEDLLDAIKPRKVIGLSTAGLRVTAEKVVAENLADDDCAFVIGGFPKGHFSESITRFMNLSYSISDMGLEAHVVIARILYECEKLFEKGIYHKGDEESREVRA